MEHDDPRYRPLLLAVKKADEDYQVAAEAGTKTWLDDYFLPELEEHGLEIAARTPSNDTSSTGEERKA